MSKPFIFLQSQAILALVSTNLQGPLAQVYQPLDLVILGLRQELHDTLSAFGQSH